MAAILFACYGHKGQCWMPNIGAKEKEEALLLAVARLFLLILSGTHRF